MSDITCYCNQLECSNCVNKSLLNHPNPDIMRLWNYEKNYLKPHHYDKNSDDKVIFKCKICNKNFFIKIKEILKRDIFCDYCVIEKLIKKNINKNKMSDKPYNCKRCNVSFQFKYQLNKHNNSKKHNQHKVIYNCQRGECDYYTNNKTNFKMHMLNNHSTTKQKIEGFPFYCRKCDIGCGSKKTYDNHIKSKKHNKTI